jgi:hypothetical protein
MLFVGYESGSKAWRLYNPTTKRVYISRDAVFEEDLAWDWGDDKTISDEDPFHFEFTSIGGARRLGAVPAGAPGTTGPSRSPPAEQRTSTSAPSGGSGGDHSPPTPAAPGVVEFVTPLTASPDLDADHDDAPRHFRTLENIMGPAAAPAHADREIIEELLAAIGDEPYSAEEALKIDEWHLAMLEEMASIKENKTWTLVNLPKGHCAIGLKWVFKLKKDENGAVIKHKARLVAEGYVQLQGVWFWPWPHTMAGLCTTWT